MIKIVFLIALSALFAGGSLFPVYGQSCPCEMLMRLLDAQGREEARKEIIKKSSTSSHSGATLK